MPSTAAHDRPDLAASVSDSLTADLLAWLVSGPRPYAEVMDAWRTACPRLPVWEDALDGGLVARTRAPGQEAVVAITPRGRAFLAGREPRS